MEQEGDQSGVWAWTASSLRPPSWDRVNCRKQWFNAFRLKFGEQAAFRDFAESSLAGHPPRRGSPPSQGRAHAWQDDTGGIGSVRCRCSLPSTTSSLLLSQFSCRI